MPAQPFFFIRVGRKHVKLTYSEVVYIESLANYVKIHTETSPYLTPMTMKQLIRLLPPEMFCRVNRSIIVPINRIISFDKDGIILKGMKFAFGEGYKKELEARIHIISQEQNNPPPMKVCPDGLQPG